MLCHISMSCEKENNTYKGNASITKHLVSSFLAIHIQMFFLHKQLEIIRIIFYYKPYN